MSDPYIGEIRMFGFEFAPVGWALCQGQLLSISQNQALYSLLGQSFGGDGGTTFALPDLRGRAPMHADSTTTVGAKLGAESVVLTEDHLPAHSHQVWASSLAATTNVPNGNTLAAAEIYGAFATASNALMGSGSLAAANASGHDNMQPSTVVNFCICLNGIFPSRS